MDDAYVTVATVRFLSVTLPPAQMKQLQTSASEEQRSVSGQVRWIIGQFLEQRDKERS